MVREKLYTIIEDIEDEELDLLIGSTDDKYLKRLADESRGIATKYGENKYNELMDENLYFEAAVLADKFSLDKKKVSIAAKKEYDALMDRPSYKACEAAAKLSDRFELGDDNTETAAMMAFDIGLEMDMEDSAESIALDYGLVDKFGLLSADEYENQLKWHEEGHYNLTGQFESIMDGSIEPKEGMVSDPEDEFKRHLEKEDFKLAFFVADKYGLGLGKKVFSMILEDLKNEDRNEKSIPSMMGILYPRRSRR